MIARQIIIENALLNSFIQICQNCLRVMDPILSQRHQHYQHTTGHAHFHALMYYCSIT